MDFMTDEEPDGYLMFLVIWLFTFYVKKEKSLPSKNLKRFCLRKIFKRRAQDFATI